MSGGSDDGADGGAAAGRTMTLAFTLDALAALADPGEAVRDAREWTDYVGVVSEEPESTVHEFSQRHRVRRDFFPRSMPRRNALVAVRGQYPTERHVYVGTAVDDRAAATETGWEYLPVEEAAERAGWTLADPGGAGDGSLVEAVKERLSKLF